MDCSSATENLVECARRRGTPGSELAAHLRGCGNCRERWEAEWSLTGELKALRQETASARMPAAARADLMSRFEAQGKVTPIRRASGMDRRWLWPAAAAAMLVVSVAVFRPFVTPAIQPPAASEEQTIFEADGYMPVPYAPPLAPGELLQQVHADLEPAELVSLGVDVDPTLNAELPADLLLGQDGLPRAIRLSEDNSTGLGEIQQ
jgi:hypothetical protein